MAINARLKTVADFVCGGALVVDVGCDHAILPIELIRKGKASRVIACDIGEGPLASANRNIKRAGLEGIIETRLSDGLEKILPDEVDHIVIAGMGGDLIARIIGNANWTRDKKYRLILQPMTSADDLRIWLLENGYEIETEKPVYDAGRLYTVMVCTFSGETSEMPEEYAYIGKISPDTAEGKDYFLRQISRIERRLSALEKSKTDHPEKEELTNILNAIKERLGE